jgi:DNA-binding transcriptional LysR family regulator
MRYSLRQLEVFLATARHENVTKAAQQLAMSQSAASGALAELEAQFGVLLFDRVGKRLRLSVLGAQVRGQAENLLEQAQEFERAIIGDGAVGYLKLGATLTIGNYLAVAMIAEFRQKFPHAEVSLSVANTESIAQSVRDFELDIGLIEGELSHSDLETLPWREDELQVFVAPDHPLAHCQTVSDNDLLAQAWIVRESGSGTRQAFDRAMRGILSKLDISMELQHTEAIKRAVAAGLGVGCLSKICLKEAFANGSLLPLEVPGRNFHRQFYIVLNRKKFRGEALSQWLKLCLKS